jgi:hypothetical protein
MEDSMVAYYQNHQWKVTELGIESLSPDFDYEVEAERLLEVAERNGETLYDLPVHMAEKCWVDIEAFIAAFERPWQFTPAGTSLSSTKRCWLRASGLRVGRPNWRRKQGLERLGWCRSGAVGSQHSHS